MGPTLHNALFHYYEDAVVKEPREGLRDNYGEQSFLSFRAHRTVQKYIH